MDKRLAFIGGGNIAQAILSGLVPTFEDPRTIIVADPSEAQGLQCKALGATWTQDNPAAVAGLTSYCCASSRSSWKRS